MGATTKLKKRKLYGVVSVSFRDFVVVPHLVSYRDTERVRVPKNIRNLYIFIFGRSSKLLPQMMLGVYWLA